MFYNRVSDFFAVEGNFIEADDPDGWVDPADAMTGDDCGDHWTCHAEPPTCGH